jgi:23S rRNA pseudouridine1911/1915/1917 synthase
MSSSRSSNSEAPAIREPSPETVPAPPGARQARVPPEAAGARLDKWLGDLPGIVSREMARRLILQGAVTVNGRAAEPARHLRAGDAVDFAMPPPEACAIPAEAGPLAVLYEDAALLVIDKAPGVPMHPGPGHRRGTLVNFVLAHCHDLSGIGGSLRPGIVHRLDKDTSGVVVVAKTDVAHQHLAAQFKAHSVHRVYRAIVVGRPPAARGTIDEPLARQESHRVKRSVVRGGKRAVTHWELERQWGPFALLRLRLETGRTHQIRVHLAHADLPVLGDPLYGQARHRGLRLPPALLESLEALSRQALHAAELGFTHPLSGERLRFSAPFPPDLQIVLEALESLAG